MRVNLALVKMYCPINLLNEVKKGPNGIYIGTMFRDQIRSFMPSLDSRKLTGSHEKFMLYRDNQTIKQLTYQRRIGVSWVS